MDAIFQLRTNAKLNLHLNIVGRRDDGYHELDTVLQSIDLGDDLDIEFTDDGRVDISCTDLSIPTDESNLCHKAVVAARAIVGPQLGAKIHLVKRIPDGAGMGGGSSNAGGVLVAARKFSGVGDDGDWQLAAASVGSDVPFMLSGGTMWGEGRGEILRPLSPLGSCYIVVVKPDVSISTAWVYGNFSFRLTKHKARLNVTSVSAVIARIPRVSPPFWNDLEDVVCPSHPVVSGILDTLLAEDPCYASMTGSGSALYAIFASEAQAATVAERFSVKGFFTSVVRPAKRAVEIRR